VGLAITIRYLSQRWQAPTVQTRVLSGLVIGFFYSLLVHSLFVGSLSGATANRETFVFLYQDFSNNGAGFAQTWLDGVYRTIVVGTVIGMLTIALQTFAGGILTGLLLEVRQPDDEPSEGPVRPPTQDAFASIVLAILPLLFFVLFLINSNIYGQMEAQVLAVGEARDIALNVGNFFNLPTLLPLGVIPLMQVLGILWLQSVGAINLHAGSLRTSQIIHGLTMGIAIIPLTTSLLPEIPQRIFILALVGIVVMLAWAYVLVAQFKLREMKNPPPDEVSIWSLLGVLSGVVTIGWLLLDFSGSRILLNLQFYPIRLADYAFRGTVGLDVPGELSVLLSDAFHNSALYIAALLAVAVISSIIVFTPVLMFINRARRRA